MTQKRHYVKNDYSCGSKYCPCCKKILKIDNFGIDQNGNSNKLRAYCKECIINKNRMTYLKRKEFKLKVRDEVQQLEDKIKCIALRTQFAADAFECVVPETNTEIKENAPNTLFDTDEKKDL